MANRPLRARSRLGKYRVLGRVAEGGFASVYRARDTIEGMDVALKVPHLNVGDGAALSELRGEVRLTAKLEHPNILPLKNAALIDEHFVIAYPLGLESLADRLRRRLSARTALSYAEQAIEAVAHAHRHGIIHCDIKPDNFILFPDDRLRLADFGIAKVAMRRMTLASGQGTVGYIAPEQALGKPTFRSDVFSLGLLVYRLFSGTLPEWPYDWPLPGIERARKVLHPDMLSMLQRCLAVDDRQRYADATALASVFRRLKPRALRSEQLRRKRQRNSEPVSWRSLRTREFSRRFRVRLETRADCGRCGGPISESMKHCPWCTKAITRYRGPARWPQQCDRCGRSAKGDHRYCAYCYGPHIQEPSGQRYSDRRYSARCGGCREPLAPFMRYCPFCRRKVSQRWTIEGNSKRCGHCHWGVLSEFWEACPWCGKRIPR